MAIFGSGQNQVYMDENGNIVSSPNYSLPTAPPDASYVNPDSSNYVSNPGTSYATINSFGPANYGVPTSPSNASNVNTDTTTSPLSTLLNQNQFTDNAISLPPSYYSPSDSSQSMSPAGSQVTPSYTPQAGSSLSPLSNPSIVPQTGSSLSAQAQPSNNITYDPTKSIDDQIKALTSVNDKNSLLSQYNTYKNVSSMFGITDPTLLSTIASNPNLNATDISNLARIAKTTDAQNAVTALNQHKDQIPNMQSLMLNSYASSIAPTAQDLNVIASRGSSIPVPVYRPASQSTNSMGDVFTAKSPILSQQTDPSGYVHITSGGKDYLINPNSNRIVSISPAGSYRPLGSASTGYNN